MGPHTGELGSVRRTQITFPIERRAPTRWRGQRQIGAKQRDGEFGPNETFEVLTPDDQVLFTETITSTGDFVLTAQSHTCSLTPVNGGFQSGVRVACDVGTPTRMFRVTDDLGKGLLRIYVDDGLVEEHVYDPDTGILSK